MQSNNGISPKNRTAKLHRPFMLTSKAVKLAVKANITQQQLQPSPNSPQAAHNTERNGSQSEIKFEMVSESQMASRVDQLNHISIGERRRKKRHSVNCTVAGGKQSSGFFCLQEVEAKPIATKQEIIIDRSLVERIVEQSPTTQQFLEEYSEEFARLDREIKCKTPTIVNVEFAFAVKRPPERAFENLKRKHRSVDNRPLAVALLETAADQQLMNQSMVSTGQHLQQNQQQQVVSSGNPLQQATVYEFRELENARYTTNKFNTNNGLQRQEERARSSLNRVQLSPIKKFTNELTQYIHKQYLNIERLRPVIKASQQHQQSLQPFENTGNSAIDHQCQGMLIRNIVMKEQSEKNRRAQQANLEAKLLFKPKDIRQPKQKQPTRTNSQDRRRQQRPAQQDFTMTRRTFNKKDYFVFGMSDRPAVENNRVEYYRDFLWKINFSNGLFIEPEVELERNYKVYVGRGNNSMLIKGLMKRRFWWTVVDKVTCTGEEAVNFVFTQLKNNDYIKIQKPFAGKTTLGGCSNTRIYSSSVTLNTTVETSSDTESNAPSRSNDAKLKEHSQDSLQTARKHRQLGKKHRQKHSETVVQATSTVRDPHELIFGTQDLMMWQAYFEKNRKMEESLNDRIYSKRAWLLKNKNASKIESSEQLRVHNHFNANYFLGNKKALFYSMRKYYELNGQNVFDFLPLTFHIARGIDDPECAKFLKHYSQIQESNQQQPANRQIKNIWIVKPGEFTNRGTGITVCANLDDVKIRLKGRERNQNGKFRTFIVQKYLQRPFLYQRRKFDIRHYMLITGINGAFKGYWYEEGYIRTTSFEYSVKNCRDNLVHLTNDAIQKHNEDYGRFEKGNKLSYQDFQRYLDQNHRGLDFLGGILPKMKRICTDAMRASYFLLDPQRRCHNFQIFGMDFMVDEDFRPWLIEINTNPCLELCCPLLSKIIPAMVENALKIGLDPLFPPPYNWPVNKKYQLGDNPMETNRFELVFDETVEGEAIQELYRNIDRVDKNMGDIEEEDEQFEDEGKEWNEEI